MDVVVDGIRYHVEVSGEGFPLLLLHGFTGDTSTWSSFSNVWGKHSMLIAPDILGHGKTESPEELHHYRIESVAHDLNVILDELGANQVDLLGYSMGGRLALTFALLFPNRVRKVILESTSPGLITVEEQEQRRLKDAELASFLIKQGVTSFVDYWEELPLFETMKKLPVSIQMKIREQRLRNDPIGLANSLLGMGTGSQPSWWGQLDQLASAILLLSGEKDVKFYTIAEKMSKKLKKVQWTTFENSGHAIHVEEAEKFGTIVSDFLQQN
ncbi:2-succinyl-6-hydroxy-2,4-cyclohexadiene-1-carboxylate synthase [Neobacillus jeddahensis]|uniref:2-succinyl-6-hydroxy-2, 4-cyclohexadiene-1-carboxylate synthase n=1 Tax=Neobacillus jeddahensis TaxID=1461580 RepID=UPI00058B5444|nr:2-succinyl-6-hydroxy-2,4-cyclohexadiene-1-carboxylate synthase [Neobacillus jeddahensis]